VKNMLAGVGGIDLAMLVIAADEGVMPQTREHLAICSLLHIRTGLVVLTKIDMVETDWVELVRDDVATLVRGTFLEGAPVVPVSAKTGAGLDELRATLRRLAETVPARGTDQLPRLPIDRVFTIKGFGTVVTGTLAAGALGVDDRVEVFPRGLVAKIRGLQTHGHAVERSMAGQRTAVNLQGLERAAVDRGDVIASRERSRPRRWWTSFSRSSTTRRARSRAATASACTRERARSWRAPCFSTAPSWLPASGASRGCGWRRRSSRWPATAS